jgi:signal peptidase I
MDAPARSKGFLRETVESVLYAGVIFLVIRTLAFQAFRIPTGSMEDTLLPGDFLFINKFAYGARLPFTDVRLPGYAQPRRGDIIVFEYPKDTKVDYIKRCVALAGQTVEVRNKQLLVDGVLQEERYVLHKDPAVGLERGDPRFDRDNFGPYKVPPGCVFMMGDNRDYSADGRFWGPLPTKLIHGRAWVTYFSWDTKSHLPRPRRMFRLIH